MPVILRLVLAFDVAQLPCGLLQSASVPGEILSLRSDPIPPVEPIMKTLLMFSPSIQRDDAIIDLGTSLSNSTIPCPVDP